VGIGTEDLERRIKPHGPEEILQKLKVEAQRCKRCQLYKTRKNMVFSSGPATAKVMIVSEAPGAMEDQMGTPFVGAAGKNLDGLLQEAGLDRKNVYVCNLLKCRPPGNRDPLPDEIEACRRFLVGQISAVGPKLVIALGRISAKELLGRYVTMGREHGKLLDCTYAGTDFKLFMTYHPAAALYGAEAKRRLQADFKKLGQLLKSME